MLQDVGSPCIVGGRGFEGEGEEILLVIVGKMVGIETRRFVSQADTRSPILVEGSDGLYGKTVQFFSDTR